MKRNFVFILFLFFVSIAFSQKGVLSGTVTDEAGMPLAGATVVIKNTFLGTITNEKGFYSFDKISYGKHHIVISYLGYSHVEQMVDVVGEQSINIVMNNNAIEMQPVIIKAIKANELTPVAKTNISKTEINEINLVQDIPYVLEQTPSVIATSENGTGIGNTGMRIRGTDMSRINVTINGIPLNDPESQGIFWVNMTDFASSVDDVQIQRGVGTSTNGAASFGGSINFQTSAVEQKPFVRATTTRGSFNTFKETYAFGTGIINNCFGFSARYSKMNSDGWIQRGASNHQSLHLTGTYFKGKHSLTANVLLGQEKTGITWWGVPSDRMQTNRRYNPSGKYIDDDGNEKYYPETDNYWQNHYMLNYKLDISKYLKFNTSLHTTTGKGYYEEYKARVDDFYTENTLAKYGIPDVKMPDSILRIGNRQTIFSDSTIRSSDMRREKWMKNIFYGSTSSINYNKDKIDASIGTSFNIYEGNHFGLVKMVKFIPDFAEFQWYSNKSSKTDFNIFAKIQYQLFEKISVYGDVQYRSLTYTMKGMDDDLMNLNQSYVWNFVNPKAGLFYKINKQNSLFTSIAVANREPTRADLKDAGKDGITKPPVPETLYDFELGYKYTIQKLTVGLNFYNMIYDNQLVLTGKLNDVGYPLMQNVKSSYRRGIELTVGVQPIKQFAWSGNITLSENKIKNYTEYSVTYDSGVPPIVMNQLGTTNISYSPNIIASNSFIFTPIQSLSFRFTSKYVGEQYFDNTSDNIRKMKPYMVHGFQTNYKLKIKSSLLQFQFMINNLFNTNYITNAYGGNYYEAGVEKSWMYYFPQAYRNYMLKIVFEF